MTGSSSNKNSLPFPMLRVLSACMIFLSLSVICSARSCRCYPGDVCWPSPSVWRDLNRSVNGRLITTVPLGAPCHDPVYDASACKSLQTEWTEPPIHYNSSSSVMAPFFANQSCDPFTPENTPCTLGNYVNYAINVNRISDIAKGIAFAIKHNIRLVIRNTGHDYLGKSTGPGSLAIWTHHLKTISFLDYRSRHYSGKAIKIGAGVQAFEAYEAANKVGLAVVGGECPTVGLAGGYTQGGGHSGLASKYGLAADQTLEWEVIDGSGKYHRASRTENPDLYWALSGGGGGTYGVVWSLTAKAHKDIPVSSANLTFTSQGISADTYYKAVGIYQASLGPIVDAGVMSLHFYTNLSFILGPLTAPGISKDGLSNLLKPFTTSLKRLGINYTMVVREFPDFLSQYRAMGITDQVGIAQYGGRLMPRSVIENNNDALTAACRSISEDGALVVGVAVNVAKSVAGNPFNAVLPAWRDTLIDFLISTPYSFTAPLSETLSLQRKMTDNYIPQLTALSPNSGCYLNEGDFLQPDWQKTFYGANYGKLRSIKKKHDPSDIFYATKAVGSDEWAVKRDGRLCRV